MSRTPVITSARARRQALGVAALVASGLMVAPGGAAAQDGTQIVPLQNAEANVQPDCPNDGNAYWHFILAPNNNTATFVSITVNVAGVPSTFTGDAIVRNAGHPYNVFVAVPAGATVESLVQSGTFAEITPATGSYSFILSHLCEGTTSTTTTSTSTTTTTTTTTASTTTLPIDTTTTTVASGGGTTTTVASGGGTTTTVASGGGTTTTTLVGSGGPTSTTTLAPTSSSTTTLVASEGPTTTRPGSLPATGTESRTQGTVALLTLGAGLFLVAVSRRRTTTFES